MTTASGDEGRPGPAPGGTPWPEGKGHRTGEAAGDPTAPPPAATAGPTTPVVEPARPVRAFLGLGANLGDPRAQLRWAVAALDREPGIAVKGVASLYGSRPVGVTDQPDFLNTVVAIDTTLPADRLLDRLLALEQQAGRVRVRRWGPRTLDIDLLWYGGQVIHRPPHLVVPHPRAAERAFVLIPWAELAPDTVLPGLGPVGALRAAVDPAGVWLEEPAPGWWQGQESPPARGE
ncbi:MAG TPA: 2-amino-4-hydroxy-6-hydroxymethyldihydropteridine diphosphokinase [Thermaerobacter sp.]